MAELSPILVSLKFSFHLFYPLAIRQRGFTISFRMICENPNLDAKLFNFSCIPLDAFLVFEFPRLNSFHFFLDHSVVVSDSHSTDMCATWLILGIDLCPSPPTNLMQFHPPLSRNY